MTTIESQITIDGERVTIRPVVGTVWMSKHQISDLFGCFVAKVVSNIAAVLKSGVLDENRVCRFHRYKNGSEIELFGLEMITALAFRIDTRNAAIFRRWLMERVAEQPHTSRQVVSVFFPVRERTMPN
jgi:hypothetical protein